MVEAPVGIITATSVGRKITCCHANTFRSIVNTIIITAARRIARIIVRPPIVGKIQPVPHFMCERPASLHTSSANRANISMLDPNPITHSCTRPTRIRRIAGCSTNIRSYIYIQILISRPISIINVVAIDNGLNLIATVISQISIIGECSRNPVKTVTVWCYRSKSKFDFRIGRHSNEIGIHRTSICIVQPKIPVQNGYSVFNLIKRNIFGCILVQNMKHDRNCVNYSSFSSRVGRSVLLKAFEFLLQ